MESSDGKLRGILPDGVVDGSPVLIKVCGRLRLTYEIRLATFFARRSGDILMLHVPEECELSQQLKVFAAEHRVLIRRR